jgi:hypothetical protein
VQRELINIVQTGGLTLDPTNDAQVLAAIQTLFLQRANNFSEIKAAGAVAQAAALTNLGSSDGTLIGRLLNVQTFAASSAYTPTPGTRLALVEMIAGGGSGASGALNGSGFYSGGGGGCSGSYLKFLIPISALATPVTVTIGSGGSSVTNAAGIAGGNTSFGTYATVLGGNGGLVLVSSTSIPAIYGMTPTRTSYTLSAAATLIDYDYGQCGGDCIIQTNGCRGGFGAASKLGGSVSGAGINTTGNAAVTPGGGGSGVASNSSSVGYASGGGFKGYLKVWEYA